MRGLSEEETGRLARTDPAELTCTETAAALREYNMWRRGEGRYCGEDDKGVYIPVGAPFSASYIGRLIDHAAGMLEIQTADPFNYEA